ncbi:hypothetical protein EQG49_01480 [Periweissella cryptocerci]|uniref:Uncharacterized protein n=1 Tax=Periweissella cryptocerci TaxID=2506420 RepID=A0A4P6YRH5_9LACO|nr:hypothetical protein [Periweissella cryptocerci]QBO35221.1 hypothetical protein EQG49_01480 [Periweissella cryptocerci]
MHNIVNKLLTMQNVSILVLVTIILTIVGMTWGEPFTNANIIAVMLLVFAAALYLVVSYRTRFSDTQRRIK